MQHGIGNLAERRGFFLGDFVDSVRGVVNKVVPRELKPILPVVAGAFLGPAVGGMFSALGPAAAGFLGAGTTSALTQALTGSGKIDPMSTLLSAGIGGIQGARVPKDFTGTEQISGPVKKPTFDQRPGMDTILPDAPTFQAPVTFTPGTEAYDAAMKNAGFFDRALMTAKEYTGSTSLNPATGRLQYDRGPDSFFKGATAFSLPYTAKAAAEEQIDLDEQERQGQIQSAADRRKDRKIYIEFVKKAGFSQEEAERMADGAGYEEGGEVTKEKRMTAQDGKFMGGLETLMEIFGKPKQPMIGEIDSRFRPLPEDTEDDVSEEEKRIALLEDEIRYLMEGGTLEANRDLIEKYAAELKMLKEKQDPSLRTRRSEGGKVPGLPRGKQVDAREGMFIPMGGAKRADDVPAMLSVNEFVLNDNAVAGLGKLMTGSPDPRAGARALYKIQDQLEAMVV
jgi:flagellar motility protein MotE (MotC chaperone)